MKRCVLIVSAVLVMSTLWPSVAPAQVPPGRVVGEVAAGVGGGVAAGGLGLVLGTAGALALSAGDFSPVAPTTGAIVGAAAGVTLGVFGAGQSMGAPGTLGEVALGTLAGATFTAATWGFAALLAKPAQRGNWMHGAFVLLTGCAPLIGAVVAMETPP